MIDKKFTIELSPPWKKQDFILDQIGAINFLVGPNGSGKSRFCHDLRGQFAHSRLLGTDRLSGMEQSTPLRELIGDSFGRGYEKNRFNNMKESGRRGSGIDSIILLEERLDLRIRVEATLGSLFNRTIRLEWDSGNLIPQASIAGTNQYYRLDRDECHGIKELLVILTHLYNDEFPYLIIDEPELNLHPQYQAFLMQEIRKNAGDFSIDPSKKIVFLITHSPFILDFRSVEDIKSVISFSQNHSPPARLAGLTLDQEYKFSSLIPRLNVHHKQLFFSDNPIFVEGVLDAQLVGCMQESRGVSIAGAGSCVIDAGGCEEVNQYLVLCMALNKKAYFLYDLDSLFRGQLRQCLKNDGSIQSFLSTAGVGSDFTKYCGELDRKLSEAIDKVRVASNVPANLLRLVEYLIELSSSQGIAQKDRIAKERVAMLTALSRFRVDFDQVLSSSDLSDIEGRLNKIVEILAQKNIYLLPGGTIERYLPKYGGDFYVLNDDMKKQALISEIEEMSKGLTSDELAIRYGELYSIISKLPAQTEVDFDRVLRDYLSQYIYVLQKAVIANPSFELAALQTYMSQVQHFAEKVFSIKQFSRGVNQEFTATISITMKSNRSERVARIDQKTNAGTGDFTIELA